MVTKLYPKFTKGFSFVTLFFLLSISTAIGQTFNYTQGGLNVDVVISNPCDGLDNGSIQFTVNSANGGSANIQTIIGPKSYFTVTNVPVGSTFIFNDSPLSGTPSLPAGDYDFIIVDNNMVDVINTFPAPPPRPATLTALTAIDLINRSVQNNTSCITPDGKFIATIDGGSKTPSLPFGTQGSFTVTLTTDNGFPVPPPFVTNGLAPLNFSNLRGGNFTVTIDDNYSFCSGVFNFTINEPTPAITLVVPSVEVCEGT
ncbi:MAG: hypothetical protein OEU76_04455, partial [Cyclobacteriaceae bacterium]|nr:hypothetical protein [Cyclobacteriaceae bacterium]